jgi:hypothetical protein
VLLLQLQEGGRLLFGQVVIAGRIVHRAQFRFDAGA